MANLHPDEVRRSVRETYGRIAKSGDSCCGPSTSPCCGPNAAPTPPALRDLGYDEADIEAVPGTCSLGLGCGNPVALASLREGETVLDLGSGGGFDCFLAAQRVGPKGRVIGVDMTPEMVEQARHNAREMAASNVDFRLGEIEHLPVADASVDVIISNCVINLSPAKTGVFREAFRVLKSGGRLAVADIVAIAAMPEELAQDKEMVSSCIGGASPVEDIKGWLLQAGFEDIHIAIREESREFVSCCAPGRGLEDIVASAMIEAVKP
jgi:SAM-dependent methyltransferase